MKRVAIVPGAFRPPTDNHLKMIGRYSGECDAVAVLVSDPKSSRRRTATGIPISAETSRKILETALADAGISNARVFVEEGSPVKAIGRILSGISGKEIVLGIGSKDDASRFSFLEKFQGMNGNRIVPPEETSVEIGSGYSASDLRRNIGDVSYLRSHLPQVLSPEHMEEAIRLLQEECGVGILKEGFDEKDVFGRVLGESSELGIGPSGIFEDENGPFPGRLDDEAIDRAKCSMNAWNMHVGENVPEGEPSNPKNCPEKAVDVMLEYPEEGISAEIFLDGNTKEWDSEVVSGERTGKLTPDQMGDFFGTRFYRRLYNRLNEMWPCSDPQFNDLVEAINEKRLALDRAEETVTEDDSERKWYDKEDSRKKNVAGRQVTTRSGRKLVTFSDFGVKHDDNEAYFVWPETDKEFKWSQWQDWTKISPLLRMRFRHQGQGDYVYGLSLSPFAENDPNRGFRAYNLTLEPKLQYLTPEETQQMMDLSIVQKFLRNAMKRLNYFMSIPDEKIVELIGSPDRVQEDEVRKTKHVIKNTMKAIREKRADTYVYT